MNYENEIKKSGLQTDLIRKFGSTDVNIFILGFGALRLEEPKKMYSTSSNHGKI